MPRMLFHMFWGKFTCHDCYDVGVVIGGTSRRRTKISHKEQNKLILTKPNKALDPQIRSIEMRSQRTLSTKLKIVLSFRKQIAASPEEGRL